MTRSEFIAAALFSEMEECILWPFAVRKSSGYGAYSEKSGGETINHDAHRFVCRAAHGDPEKAQQAAHKCGNKLCINPKHLYWASPLENMQDAISHRTLKGGGRYRQKIFETDAVEIANSNESYSVLASRYGVDTAYIGKVRRKMSASR